MRNPDVENHATSGDKETALDLQIILYLTVITAGAVDIISFTRLGGIFASAMTGNLALLALYAAEGSVSSAIGSVIALLGFMAGAAAGNLLTRNKAQRPALMVLLSMETMFLLGVTALWFLAPSANGSLNANALITLLAISMGLQIIAGKRINLANIPTIVFTSTLTNIVTGITATFADKKFMIRKDNRHQLLSSLMYFSGALLAGVLVYRRIWIFAVLPLGPIVLALLILIISYEEVD